MKKLAKAVLYIQRMTPVFLEHMEETLKIIGGVILAIVFCWIWIPIISWVALTKWAEKKMKEGTSK